MYDPAWPRKSGLQLPVTGGKIHDSCDTIDYHGHRERGVSRIVIDPGADE